MSKYASFHDHVVVDIVWTLNLSRLFLALHKDFGPVVMFCDHVILRFFGSKEMSGGREWPHIC